LSQKPPSSSAIKVTADKFARLRRELDLHVVGHEAVKEALLLGLVAREHIYIEGPPGIAKTLLAETASEAANLGFYFYQFHRDTRLAELVGDVVIQRETGPDGGEVIRQTVLKGGILTAEVCVLDDLSRAPGEALNVLLRLLNERKYHAERIPLLTAIATSNPALDDYYNEPLDPANLDRFTLQLRADGLIHENRWADVEKVINLFAGTGGAAIPKTTDLLCREDFDQAARLMDGVLVPENTKLGLLHLLNRWVNKYKLEPSNSLITDRTFLVKGVKIMKAAALLDGRHTVVPEDLHILRHLTTFRLPPEVHNEMESIVTDTLNSL